MGLSDPDRNQSSRPYSNHISLLPFFPYLFCFGFLNGNRNIMEDIKVFSKNLYGLIMRFNNVPFRLRFNWLCHYIFLKMLSLLEGWGKMASKQPKIEINTGFFFFLIFDKMSWRKLCWDFRPGWLSLHSLLRKHIFCSEWVFIWG